MSYSTQQLRKTCTTHTHTHKRNFCPSPMATAYCHRSSQDHARPGFLAPAFVIFLLSKNNSVHFFVVYTKKSLQTTLSFFGIDLEDLSGIYLKITTNIYVVFKGYLEGPLVRFFGFCSNPLSRLWLHFCSVFLGMCMENVVIGVGQSYFTATKS